MLFTLVACIPVAVRGSGDGKEEPPDSGGEEDSGRDTSPSDAGESDGGDSGDTGADPSADETEVLVLPRSAEELISPWNLRLTPDLDGDGTAQLVAPSVDDPRGLEVWDLDGVRSWTPRAKLAGVLRTPQAGHLVAVAGDYDGDGLPELLVLEYAEVEHHEGEFDALARWWSVARDEEVGRLAWDETSALASPASLPPYPLPDYDGDGLPEFVICTDRAVIFRGSSVGPGMSGDEAWFSIDTRAMAYGVAVPDGDGDGLSELALPIGQTTGVLYSATMARGVDIAEADIPTLATGTPRSYPVPRTVDLDGDGLSELLLASDSGFLGFAGTDVLATLRGERGTLTPADASFTYTVQRVSYFGLWTFPFAGAVASPGLAASMYFNSRVAVLDGDAVRAGGEVPTDAVSEVTGPGWYGYAMGGGEDLDGNGSYDLVVGAVQTPDGLDLIEVWLAPTPR